MNALSLALTFLPILDVAAEQARRPLSPRIDLAIARPHPGRAAAPLCDDAAFLRRVSLDLTGLIPSTETTRAFLADQSPDRRARLVDRLLASDLYARHFALTFDVLLMDRRPGEQVKLPDWYNYLRKSFADNKPIDRLVQELLQADGSDVKHRASARFLLDRKVDAHTATKDISRLFLGMNLTCCQCHDHPLVDGFRQDHYYGLYAFLNRSYAFADKKTKVTVVAEKAEGDVQFESVFKPKDKHKIGPKLPFATALLEPALEKGKEYVAPFGKDERGVPRYSRRSRLGNEITSHPRFARTIANRVWSWLMGRGVVHPVDFDHEGNPPSNPELLELLTADFRANGHDLKRLVREIVLSQAYQRSSAAGHGGTSAGEFWVGAIRPLSPEQFAWSLARATGQIEAELKAPKATEAAALAKLTPPVHVVAALYAGPPGEPAQDFEATLDQALFLINGKTLETWLAPRAGALTDRLAKIADARVLADELYLSMLVRLPSDEERDEVASHLNRAGANRAQSIRDLAWALATSVEFRFNH